MILGSPPISRSSSTPNRKKNLFLILLSTLLYHEGEKVKKKEKGLSALLFDVDQDAWEYMRKKRRDVKVEPPRRMATHSQTKAVAEDQKSQLPGIAPDDLRSSA
jgi:hypothetical protein